MFLHPEINFCTTDSSLHPHSNEPTLADFDGIHDISISNFPQQTKVIPSFDTYSNTTNAFSQDISGKHTTERINEIISRPIDVLFQSIPRSFIPPPNNVCCPFFPLCVFNSPDQNVILKHIHTFHDDRLDSYIALRIFESFSLREYYPELYPETEICHKDIIDSTPQVV